MPLNKENNFSRKLNVDLSRAMLADAVESADYTSVEQ